MARARFKRGILEFSTNPETRKLIKNWIVGVHFAVSSKMSNAYVLLGKKRDQDGPKR